MRRVVRVGEQESFEWLKLSDLSDKEIREHKDYLLADLEAAAAAAGALAKPPPAPLLASNPHSSGLQTPDISSIVRGHCTGMPIWDICVKPGSPPSCYPSSQISEFRLLRYGKCTDEPTCTIRVHE